MSLKKSWILGILTLSIILSSPAHALDVSGLGVMTLSNLNVSSPAAATAKVGFGLGALGAISISPFFSLESGALFLSHETTVNSGLLSREITNDFIEIPVMLRFSPVSFVAVNAGVYYGVGTSSSITTQINPSTSVTSSGPKSNDFGFILGGGIRWPIAPMIKLRADLLYELGLVDLGTIPGITQYSRNIDVLAGLMIELW